MGVPEELAEQVTLSGELKEVRAELFWPLRDKMHTGLAGGGPSSPREGGPPPTCGFCKCVCLWVTGGGPMLRAKGAERSKEGSLFSGMEGDLDK